VPADTARLQIVDRIFTRVGASDDIAGGRSTFMVEMTELADILNHADQRSLVLLDEVGRGTSTTDGFALAQAVTEHLHDEVGAMTLFATHHHELTAVAASLTNAHNLYFRTQRDEDGVHFEHAVERGTADASYGVEVAATAGVDAAVVERARELLGTDPGDEYVGTDPTTSDDARTNGQSNTSNEHGEDKSTQRDGDTRSIQDVETRLLDADIATMTPLDALNLLAELQRRVESATADSESPQSQ
jgi:DNA mismatch repair protein MutS